MIHGSKGQGLDFREDLLRKTILVESIRREELRIFFRVSQILPHQKPHAQQQKPPSGDVMGSGLKITRQRLK